MTLEWIIVGVILAGAIVLLSRRRKPRCNEGCDFCPEGKKMEAPDE
jgi:hypothetical protein